MKILLGFGDERGVLGRHLKEALGRSHTVWSCGTRRPTDSTVHEIPAEIDTPLPDLVARCPEPPEAFIFIDGGIPFFPADVDRTPLRRLWWFSDAHVCFEPLREWACLFHAVAVSTRPEADAMAREHFPATWLPYGCSDVHRADPDGPRDYDLAFVGTLRGEHPDHAPRARLLERLARRYRTRFLYGAFDQDLTGVNASARMVFNRSIRGGLNMRVFEALASGSLLLTDRVPGLEDLFEDGRHLALYDDDRIEEVIDRHLADDALRRRVAREGQAEVFRRHTYLHRAETLVSILSGKDLRPPPLTPFLRRAVYAKVYFNLGRDERGLKFLTSPETASNVLRFRWYRRAVRWALAPMLFLNRIVKWMKRAR